MKGSEWGGSSANGGGGGGIGKERKLFKSNLSDISNIAE